MKRTEPPSGVLDPRQPWYSGGQVGEITWRRLKLKLTGRKGEGGEQYSSFVNLSDADADRLISNLKKDSRGFPRLNESGKDGGYSNLQAYQEWLVEEYLEGPFREKTNQKIEQAAIDSRLKEIQEQKKQKAQSFISQSSTLKPGRKISVKVSKMSGIIPKRSLPKEVESKIVPTQETETDESVASPSKKVVSSLGRLTLDLVQINDNLDKIKDVIAEDYAQTKKKNKEEIEDYRKRVANRQRKLPKKDLGDNKKSLKDIIKPFVGSFFSGVGGAIRSLAAFNLMEALLNGDYMQVFKSLMGIGITFIPQIGTMIAGVVLKSLLKGFGRGMMGRGARMPMGRPGRMSAGPGIGKFGAMMALGTGALALGSAFASSQDTGGEDQTRLEEVTAEQKALTDQGLVSITQADLKKFQDLNKKFETLIDQMMGKRSSKGSGAGSGGESGTEQTDAPPPSGAPVNMNMEARGTVEGEYFDMKSRIELLKKVGATDEEAMRLAAIAGYESGGGSKKHNPKYPDNSYGLWQINMLDRPGYMLGAERRSQFKLSSNEDLFDPVTNAQAALAILRSSGWGAWTTNTKVTEQDLKESRKALENIKGGNASGGYTTKQKRVDISSTAPPARGVLVSMIPTPTGSEGVGSATNNGTVGDDYVDPNNREDTVGILYRTQMNIMEVG